MVFAAAPGVQLNVFNSAAYAQLWQDSAFVAQTFTTQVRVLSEIIVICSKTTSLWNRVTCSPVIDLLVHIRQPGCEAAF